jgi:hypothetical protein
MTDQGGWRAHRGAGVSRASGRELRRPRGARTRRGAAPSLPCMPAEAGHTHPKVAGSPPRCTSLASKHHVARAYKRDCSASPRGHARRRNAMAAAKLSCHSAHPFGRVTFPTPCLGPIGAQSITCCPAFRRTSPDAQMPRPPPTPSVGHARRRRYHPDFDHQRPRGSPWTPPCFFPAELRRDLAGIPVTAPPPWLRDPIARGIFSPRADLQ